MGTLETAMGHWEQIGEENRALRGRRKQLHAVRRALSDAFGLVLLIAASLVLWALMLAPFWHPTIGWLGH